MLLFIALGALLAAPMKGEEDFSFLTTKKWYIDSGIYVRDLQTASFRKNDTAGDTVFYKQRLDWGIFCVFYDFTGQHIKMMGRDFNKDGNDDTLNVIRKYDDGFFTFEQPEDPFISFGGGRRKGPIKNPDHPYVGTWHFGSGRKASEVRLIEKGDYPLFMELSKIKGFGIREGWYLLKYMGNNVFETDDTFPDGKLRLEVKGPDEIILRPLYTLPRSEGLLDPVRIYAGR